MAEADVPARDGIEFVLNGEPHAVAGNRDRTTVLRYLRDELGLMGTKEGCGTGDCGACTAVVAEPDAHQRLRWRPVNTCLMLVPALAGRVLVTVEGLRDGQELHPVQEALVRHHASQCGFCTPGIVMALFALSTNEPHPTRQRICESLAGNLCRCTGYRPIIDAAADVAARPPADISARTTGAADDHATRERLTQALARLRAPTHRDAPKRHGEAFLVPNSVAQLARLLADRPDVTLIAGGTDLLAAAEACPRSGAPLIALSDVPTLKRIEIEDDATTLGAMVSVEDAFATLMADHPTLDVARRRFAGPAIRAAASLGGNLANASPIADWFPILIALGASVQLRSSSGVRRMAVEDFVTGSHRTARRSDEFVEWIRVPRAAPTGTFRFYKVSKRTDQDIATVSAGLWIDIRDRLVQNVRIAYGGLDARPRRARGCERALLGRIWSREAVEAACTALASDFEPRDDLRGSREYRTLVAANLLRRFRVEIEGASPVGIWDFDGRAE